jgi:hypothetical protein
MGFTSHVPTDVIKLPPQRGGSIDTLAQRSNRLLAHFGQTSRIQPLPSCRTARISFQITEMLEDGSVAEYFSPDCHLNCIKQTTALIQSCTADLKWSRKELLNCNNHDSQHVKIINISVYIHSCVDDPNVEYSSKSGVPSNVHAISRKAQVSAFQQNW